MEVFRICHKKWDSELIASGYPAKWNSMDIYTIYSAATRSLACLENIVHLSGISLPKDNFKLMVINIPDDIIIKRISLNELPTNWHKTNDDGYEICQDLGDLWNIKRESAVMEVPSAIINKEKNYLLNPNHPDFKKIKLIDTEPFYFDPRIIK